jgi:chromosome segregation ATPase
MTAWMRPSASSTGLADDGPGGDLTGGDGGWMRRRTDDRTTVALAEGQARVIDLIDSLQQHQKKQDLRAEEISSSLSQVATTLHALEQVGRDQVERLTRIADELHVSQERWGQAAAAIAELPRYAEAQQAALTAVARQMDGLANRDERMGASLDSLREAVTALGEATTSSSVAIKSLQMSALENHERVAGLVQTQNRRFVLLFAVTLVLVGVVAVVGLAGWWRH